MCRFKFFCKAFIFPLRSQDACRLALQLRLVIGFDQEARHFPLLIGLQDASILEGFRMFLSPSLRQYSCRGMCGCIEGMLSLLMSLRMSGSSLMDLSNEFLAFSSFQRAFACASKAASWARSRCMSCRVDANLVASAIPRSEPLPQPQLQS